MSCSNCGSKETIEGTLEGISFLPKSEYKKKLASGVYGITASACTKCGNIFSFKLDTDTLTKILKK